jgi:predicted dehydrogenase
MKTAIIGTGKSVGNHLTALQALSHRLELVAAVDIDEARLKAVCAEANIPRAYTSSSEMLRIEKPDLVQIITPPASHKKLIIEALEAGAWVFCEKPLCLSLAEFDEISQAEARTGRYVSTVFQWRFGSAAQHLKSMIAAGVLGKSLVGVCNTLWYRNQDYYNDAWRGRWASEVGGPTATLGIHLMDMFLWLMGDWQELSAQALTLERQIEVEDVSMAHVRFENGAMASIINSVLSPRQESYMRLDFQKATVEVKALYRYSNENWKMSLPDGAADTSPLDAWESLQENFAGSHGSQIVALLDAMEVNERPPVSGHEGRRILEFIASLYKSAFTGKPVRRGEISPDDPFYCAMNGKAE